MLSGARPALLTATRTVNGPGPVTLIGADQRPSPMGAAATGGVEAASGPTTLTDTAVTGPGAGRRELATSRITTLSPGRFGLSAKDSSRSPTRWCDGVLETGPPPTSWGSSAG